MTVKKLVEPTTRATSALIQRTSTQSAGTNPTVVSFTGTDIYDPDGWHNPSGANPTRLTCPPGFGGQVFLVWATLEWNPTGLMFMLRKNGTEVLSLTYVQNYDDNISAMVYLADGDYVEVSSNTSSGASLLDDGPTRFGVMNAGSSRGGAAGALAVSSYSPSGDNTYTITATSDADVDATNVKVTFTAPTSGKVLVKVSSLFNDNVSNVHWTLRESTTTVADNYMASQFGKAIRSNATFYVTGLTAGSSYTYKLGCYVNAGSALIHYGSTSSKFGPILMEVWDAAPGSGGSGGSSSSGSSGARHFVQQASTSWGSTSNPNLTLGAAPASGNRILLYVLCESSQNVSSITQTNVTWAKLLESTASTTPHIELWCGTAAASAGTGITVNMSANNYCGTWAAEFSGLTGTVTTSNVKTNTAAPAGDFTGVITPTSATSLVVAAFTANGYGAGFAGVWSGQVQQAYPVASSAGLAAIAWGFPGVQECSMRTYNSNGPTGQRSSIIAAIE